MGDVFEDDFGKPLLEAIERKYPGIYKMINEERAYLVWEDFSVDLSTKEAEVLVYTSDLNDYVGKFLFKVKIHWNENGEWFPDGIVKTNVKFI
jgi:hypothetical protein